MLGWSNSPNAFSSSTSSESFGRFGNGGTSNFANSILNIFDYSSNDKHKTTISRTGIVSLYTVAYSTRWANASAVTSITIFPDSGNFNSGSTFAMYGIEA
jgi:hypothetical protein